MDAAADPAADPARRPATDPATDPAMGPAMGAKRPAKGLAMGPATAQSGMAIVAPLAPEQYGDMPWIKDSWTVGDIKTGAQYVCHRPGYQACG